MTVAAMRSFAIVLPLYMDFAEPPVKGCFARVVSKILKPLRP
ncbi:MAG: hypothetical protein AAFR64_09180 [Pseudomonadota bacterium]